MAVRAFVADIPTSVSDEALAKLYTWSREKFEQRDIVLQEDGSYVLGALVPEGINKNVRDWQRLLRTNLLNWGVEMPKLQKGWLRAVSMEQYVELVANQEETQEETAGSHISAAVQVAEPDDAHSDQGNEAPVDAEPPPPCRDLELTAGPEQGGADIPAAVAPQPVCVTAVSMLRLRPPINLLTTCVAVC